LILNLERLDTKQREEVLTLIADATNLDGVPPVSEHVLLHLRHGGDKSDSHLIAIHEDQVAGYAHLDLTDLVEGPSAELVIAPKFRGKGIGSELLKSLTQTPNLRLWSHGDLPGAKNLALANGFERVRTVIQMRRSLTDAIDEIDPNISIRSFLPGIDNQSWLELNNRAFKDHPEQSNWGERDLEIRTKESWFDPTGFLIAELDKKLAGFCWTKVHGKDSHDHDPIGEIYIMGVDPAFQGKGIGRAVTIAGLKHLRYQGIFSAMLYVDELNSSAIKLYKSLGFKEWGRDVLYRLH
jgi:mycothiol synthase